jgi:hypothetical protein
LIWSCVAQFGGYETNSYGGGSNFDQALGQKKTAQFLRLLPDDVKQALINKASEEDTHLNVSVTGDGINSGMGALFYPFLVYPNATYSGGALGTNPYPMYPNYGGSAFVSATTQDTVNLIRSAIDPVNANYQSQDFGSDTMTTPSDSSSSTSSSNSSSTTSGSSGSNQTNAN